MTCLERPCIQGDAELIPNLDRKLQGRRPDATYELVGVRLADPDPAEVRGFEGGNVGLHTPTGMLTTYISASEKVCGARNDTPFGEAHNVWMEHNHLRAWRKFRHMTLDEVAAEVGTTKAVIQQLEVGRMSLSHKWLVRIAPVLKTTPGMLLDHDPNDLPTAVLETWASIPETDRPAALRMLESLAQKTGTDG